jgi:hypothetical protein
VTQQQYHGVTGEGRCSCGRLLGEVLRLEDGLWWAPTAKGLERIQRKQGLEPIPMRTAEERSRASQAFKQQLARAVAGEIKIRYSGALAAMRRLDPPEPPGAAPIEAFCRGCTAVKSFDVNALRACGPAEQPSPKIVFPTR